MDCNTLYILDDEIYPVITKQEKHIGYSERYPEIIQADRKVKILRGLNLAINVLTFVAAIVAVIFVCKT